MYVLIRKMSQIEQSIFRRIQFGKVNNVLKSNRYFRNCPISESNKYKGVVKRCFSSQCMKTNISQEETQSFLNVFPVITKDLTDHEVFSVFPDMKNRLVRMMEYSLLAGNKNVPLTTLMVYKSFVKSDDITDENMYLAYILGWLTELTQVAIFMNTDVTDQINTRNNIPTWHTHADVRLKAANDSTILENSIFLFLKKYFSSLPCYKQFIDLFNDAIYKTFQGIALESCDVSIEKFSMERLNRIAKYKLGYSSYLLPIYSAMYLANKRESIGVESIENILFEMAKYGKIQSDFLDSFNSLSFNTNIRLGRCSWLALRAFKKASTSQKELLKEYYGRLDDESVAKILFVYKELGLPKDFQNYRRESFQIIMNKIDEIPKYCETAFLHQVLNNTFLKQKP